MNSEAIRGGSIGEDTAREAIIGRARAILMRDANIAPRTASERLDEVAQAHGIGVLDVATAIVDLEEACVRGNQF